MKQTLIESAVLSVGLFVLCAVGGLFHPNTVAGSIAKFVWSLQ